MAFADPLALLRTYLDGQLADPVATRVPDPRPAKWLQLRRVGGPKQPPVRERPRIDVIAWGSTEPDAMALLLEARKLINDLARTSTLGVVCYRVEETLGPRQDDDPETGTPRAWMTFSLLIRAEDVVY